MPQRARALRLHVQPHAPPACLRVKKLAVWCKIYSFLTAFLTEFNSGMIKSFQFTLIIMKKRLKKPASPKKEDINDIFPVDAPFDDVAFKKMLKRVRHLSIFDIDELEKQYNR